MQTFLPFRDYEESAEALDNTRLHNQFNEAYIIANTLLGAYPKGWKNHPATRMWVGAEGSLTDYMMKIVREWDRRRAEAGKEIISTGHWTKIRALCSEIPDQKRWATPAWLGDERLHSSHRSNLIRKDPDHYRVRLGWKDDDDIPYWWPVSSKRR